MITIETEKIIEYQRKTGNISVITIFLKIVIDNFVSYRIIYLYTMAGVNYTSYFFTIILTLKNYLGIY
jgi:hypothetical protein